jgi:hypothetical protein
MATAEVISLSKDQYEAFLDAEIQRWTERMTLAEFIAAYRSNELDESDPQVARLAALVGLGQNGR